MPHSCTHPDVLTRGVAEGWADPEEDPARIDWPARQAAAAIPFQVAGGRPVNPCASTGIRRGRNQLGRWGENLMADALVTVTSRYLQSRYLLMVERGDGHGWAVPGGQVEPGETGVQAAIRELAEETALAVAPDLCRAMPPRCVPDPRSSDEAWAVTIPVAVDLGQRDLVTYGLPHVSGGDDARRAEWVFAPSYPVRCPSSSAGTPTAGCSLPTRPCSPSSWQARCDGHRARDAQHRHLSLRFCPSLARRPPAR